MQLLKSYKHTAQSLEMDRETFKRLIDEAPSFDAAVKQHQAILTFGNPKLNEYLITGESIEVNGVDVSKQTSYTRLCFFNYHYTKKEVSL